MNHYNYTVLARATLAGPMDATQLTMSVSAGLGAGFPTGECSITISEGDLSTPPTLNQLANGETIRVESRSTDSFTLLERDVNGNASPLTHSAGDLVQLLWTPDNVERLMNKIDDLENLLALTLGNLQTGVRMVGPSYTELKVEQQTVADMTVKVNAGPALVDRVVARLTATTNSATITAPSTNDRIDLISLKEADHTVVVTTGVEDPSPSAPATPSGHVALATILLTTSHTTIVDGDITDVRVAL